MSDALLNSLAAAVAASPEDPELRALYAERLAEAGRRDEGLGQAMVVLSKAPGHAGARALVDRLTGEAPSDTVPGEGAAGASSPPEHAAYTTETPRPQPYQPHGQGDSHPETPGSGVDWRQLENQFENPLPPPFIVEQAGQNPDGTIDVGVSEAPDGSLPVEVSRETMRLSDVGGLVQVKQRIRETFLDPIAHPEIAKAFKKSLGGGLLLYGPPGCGKTYLARAIAGELGAHFISVTLADVLSKWMGESEGNIHKTFTEARQKAPAVLFLDEIDAVGGKRSSQGSQWLRNLVNQLLMEMDGVGSDNDGLFVLAATNMPWDVDAALLRPGRFDRMVLVSPPDEPAREAILRSHLEQRPIQGIDLPVLVRKTEGFSGADLKHLCDTAAEKALAASIKSGAVQPVSMGDMNRALKEVRPSIGPWLDSARNVANYANTDGRYDDLVQLLKQYKRF
ncbi:AAA family ATPase [Leucobacter chironomi]|uniref:AAA family ATPase n=1 Tax=Leucobacter chironomi TaxID=491918 RepID=UPI00041D3710|nr:AAA family ATPase [Leucobacter chironomi]